jgi:hypothetical protein
MLEHALPDELHGLQGGSMTATVRFKTIHMCLDVRGALRLPKRTLAGMCSHDDGRRMTGDEAFNALCDALAEGKEKLPIGDCDDFDFKTGCRGHRREENTP